MSDFIFKVPNFCNLSDRENWKKRRNLTEQELIELEEADEKLRKEIALTNPIIKKV